jgi:hypothetical protein
LNYFPAVVNVRAMDNRAATNNTTNCKSLFIIAYSSSGTRIRFIRIVGEAVTLVLRSTYIQSKLALCFKANKKEAAFFETTSYS